MNCEPHSSMLLFAEPTTLLLLGVPILGLLLVGLISLIANPRTRIAGIVLLAVFVGVPLLLLPVAAVFWVGISAPVPERAAIRPNQPMRQESWPSSSFDSDRTSKDPSPAAPQVLPTPPAAQPTAEASAPAPEEKQPIDKALTAESARLIDALSRILAKTIIEDHKAWEDLAAKTTKQMAQPAEQETPTASAEVKPAEAPAAVEANLPPKPSWVDRPLHREGNGYMVDAVGEPFATEIECEAALADCVWKKAVCPYVENFLPEASGKVDLPPAVLRNFVVGRWVEKRSIHQGEVQMLHALVQLDPGAQRTIADAYRQTIAVRHLQKFGTYFGAGFLLLAAAWGYLKADSASGGRRRGVLRTAVVLVILSVAAAVAVAMMV